MSNYSWGSFPEVVAKKGHFTEIVEGIHVYLAQDLLKDKEP